MPLIDQPFADTFTFSRDRAAGYIDAAGVEQLAAIDAPRFDHTPAGAPRGLLIEGRPSTNKADRLAVVDGDWADKAGTVLHEFEDEAGQLVRRAWYALNDALSAVNACLNAKGRHRRIVFVPGMMRNRGGWVRWADTRWELGGLVAAGAGQVVAAADNIPLLEG